MRLRWEHILWSRRVMLVPYGKSFKSKRFVPLSDRVRELLQLRQADVTEEVPSPWVFPSKRAHCGHLTTVAKQWTATVLAANIEAQKQKKPLISEELVLYCARHTFATDMLEQMDVVQVKDLMGHESLGTTMKYLHPKTSGATDAVNRRNAARGLHIVTTEPRQDYDKTSDIAISVAV